MTFILFTRADMKSFKDNCMEKKKMYATVVIGIMKKEKGRHCSSGGWNEKKRTTPDDLHKLAIQ